eukprot:6092782-Amphidinium_carterae.1
MPRNYGKTAQITHIQVFSRLFIVPSSLSCQAIISQQLQHPNLVQTFKFSTREKTKDQAQVHFADIDVPEAGAQKCALLQLAILTPVFLNASGHTRAGAVKSNKELGSDVHVRVHVYVRGHSTEIVQVSREQAHPGYTDGGREENGTSLRVRVPLASANQSDDGVMNAHVLLEGAA